jgi:hypothetical protein
MTHEVPRAEWQAFFQGFSGQHRAWLATIHGLERGVPLTRVPSAAITAVSLEEDGNGEAVRVTLGNHLSLWLACPRVVRIQQADDGADRALEVEAPEQSFLRIAFRASARPEELDGLAPGEVAANTFA